MPNRHASLARLRGIRLAPLALVALGGVLFVSAVQHALAPPELRAHYVAVGFGERGTYLVGLAQGVAAIFLIFPKTRHMASIAFASVMLLALISQLARGFSWAALQPLGLLLWAALPTLYNFKRKENPVIRAFFWTL